MDLLLQRLDLFRRDVADRVESGFEQLHQVGGGVRILGQRVVAVLLCELSVDPLPVLPVGAQDLDLAPVQRGENHQSVQRVGFRLTPPNRTDGVGHARCLCFQVQYRAAPIQHAEVMDVGLPFAK